MELTSMTSSVLILILITIGIWTGTWRSDDEFPLLQVKFQQTLIHTYTHVWKLRQLELHGVYFPAKQPARHFPSSSSISSESLTERPHICTDWFLFGLDFQGFSSSSPPWLNPTCELFQCHFGTEIWTKPRFSNDHGPKLLYLPGEVKPPTQNETKTSQIEEPKPGTAGARIMQVCTW